MAKCLAMPRPQTLLMNSSKFCGSEEGEGFCWGLASLLSDSMMPSAQQSVRSLASGAQRLPLTFLLLVAPGLREPFSWALGRGDLDSGAGGLRLPKRASMAPTRHSLMTSGGRP